MLHLRASLQLHLTAHLQQLHSLNYTWFLLQVLRFLLILALAVAELLRYHLCVVGRSHYFSYSLPDCLCIGIFSSFIDGLTVETHVSLGRSTHYPLPHDSRRAFARTVGLAQLPEWEHRILGFGYGVKHMNREQVSQCV